MHTPKSTFCVEYQHLDDLFVRLYSCRASQSYLVFFLTNKEHEQEVVIGRESKEEIRTKTDTWKRVDVM